MKVLYNKILVEVIKEEEKQVGSIIMPFEQNPFKKGKVLGVGKGIWQNGVRIPQDIEVGDIVIYGIASGIPFESDAQGKPTKVILSDVEVYAIED